eukprot:scaffold57628_cov57-Cyclotella_meneghiniana.AAC.3
MGMRVGEMIKGTIDVPLPVPLVSGFKVVSMGAKGSQVTGYCRCMVDSVETIDVPIDTGPTCVWILVSMGAKGSQVTVSMGAKGSQVTGHRSDTPGLCLLPQLSASSTKARFCRNHCDPPT